MTTTITVPIEKASDLLKISKASPETLKILAKKIDVEPLKLQALEKKLLAFQYMI